MKIYTRIVMDSATGAIEEADFFDYEGPLALCGGGGKGDAPDPPDYPAAATATSQGSVQAAIANNLMAHPDIYTPLGSQTWTQSGTSTVPGVGGQPGFNIPTYSQNINMSPEGQNLYDQQMDLSTGLLGLGNTSLDQTQASLGAPQDFSSVQDIADQSYGMQTARLDPQWAQRKGQFDQQMANQGITAGGEAYDNASRDFGQQRNDAYNQARLSSISTMPQTFQLSSAQRMQPLTELNAIRTGAQPQMPQFQPTQYSMGAQGPNMLGAAQSQYQGDLGAYNAQVGGQNSMMGGLFGLGSAALMSPAGTFGAFSDRRLKSNIERIGTHPLGIGIYEYDIFGERDVGVMADEVLAVKPEAVARHASGYLMVDYGRL